MRIVDVCPFYTPSGGGVRTYLEQKLKAAPALGHEMILLAPGAEHSITEIRPGAIIATVPAPTMPLDRRYHYFEDIPALHQALDEWRPDHIEASSPWSSATAVARWQGSASRSLVMHADPMASYAYRWFGKVASVATIDRWFGRFWGHLRGLDSMFDVVVTANDRLTNRLREGGLLSVETIRMGVQPATFSPTLRDERLRAAHLASLGLPDSATLLLGLGRMSAEKRWPMVVKAARQVARDRPVGLILAGNGPGRAKIERAAAGAPHVRVIDPIIDRHMLATMLASADGLVHGCESETFCMVAAEARASGVPLIVPDQGGAADLLVPGAGRHYQSAQPESLTAAINDFLDRGTLSMRHLAATAALGGATMTDHFTALFARYDILQGAVELSQDLLSALSF